MQKKYSNEDYLKNRDKHLTYVKNYKATEKYKRYEQSEGYKNFRRIYMKNRYHFNKEQVLMRSILLI